MRQRKCAICKTPFTKQRMGQCVCSPVCAIAYAKQQADKADRKITKAKLEKLKTRSDYMKEAQIAFNSFIRARDAGKPCICCGKPLPSEQIGGGFDAGHYRSVGSAPHLRFDERNCHGQQKQCNRYGAGRAVDYRLGLIHRIGIDAVESLESDQSVKKYTIDELKDIKATYKRKLKELKA